MKLSLEEISSKKSEFEKAKISLPAFDIAKMRDATAKNPTWLHFGAGNIFRGYIADLDQKLLEGGAAQTGIIAADTFDYEIIDSIYDAFDNLTLFVGLKPDGNNTMHVIASVAQALRADSSNAKDFARLKEIAVNPSLQMVSFTITEKGYAVTDLAGNLFPVVQQDIEQGPKSPRHAMSVVAALVYERYLANKAPLALVSMDNCSHNGEKLQNAVLYIAKLWKEKGFVDQGFLDYLNDKSKIAFPWSMIDKITPRPDSSIEKMLNDAGVENMKPITTSKKTFIAPFVNAELPQYLVVEDSFPNGRPALEKAGVFLTDREHVNKAEVMKVTTCLNPLHTALAVFGCLLGFNKIADEMLDDDLRTLVERMGHNEALPVVVDPEIIKPLDFINEVLKERLPNPYLPDTPQRIATDTSQKVGIRFGETIKAYTAKNEQQKLELIPLVIAAWLRYLLGFNDKGEKMELSADPMLSELQNKLGGVALYQKSPDLGGVREILSNKTLFGSDLCQIGLAEKICGYFVEMIQSNGAVRQVLHKALA